jgi:hypothetical protein
MNKSLYTRWLFALVIAVSGFATYAQSEIEMADGLRSSGKIYVVVAVVLVILVGLFFSLFRMEKRLKNLENEKK